MKVLVLGRGAPEHAEDFAAEIEAQFGIRCGGQSFEIDAGTHKMQRASLTAGFAEIADSIEQTMAQDVTFRRSRIVLVAAASDAGGDQIPDGLIATDQTFWFNLVALLVLAFPDIHWVFATTPDEHARMEAEGLELHSLPEEQFDRLRHIVALREDGHEPLFDPTGLRDRIKQQSYAKLDILVKLNGTVQCPARDELALVIDDEVEVASAVAYLHYLQGYRSLMVATEKQLREALHFPQFTRTAESFTVKFPDASLELQELLPDRRPEVLPKLATVPPGKRFVYTIDDHRSGAEAHEVGRITVVRRPFGGMPELSAVLGLDPSPPRFVWPPANLERGHTPGQHAMPGFLTMVARRLLQRCVDPSHSAHRTAIFALEAQELLLNRVPSLSLEAHRQRLSAELRLESEVPTLFGASALPARVRLAPRFDQVEREIESMLAVIYNPSGDRREQLRQAFASQLVGTMVDQYRQGYHFHEELATIAQQREMDLRGAGRYFALVLRRPRNFFLALIGWASIFAVIYVLLAAWNQTPVSFALFGRAALVSFYTLASVGLPPDAMFGELAVSGDLTFLVVATLECMAGLVHWGLGFAHLYTLVSRR